MSWIVGPDNRWDRVWLLCLGFSLVTVALCVVLLGYDKSKEKKEAEMLKKEEILI